MRDITEVIPRVLAVIPEEEDYLRTSFERILVRARVNARWQPPEFYWEMGAHVLYERFKSDPPDVAWYHELKQIWMGTDVDPEELRAATLPPRAEREDLGVDRKLLVAIVVLFLLGVAVYLKART